MQQSKKRQIVSLLCQLGKVNGSVPLSFSILLKIANEFIKFRLFLTQGIINVGGVDCDVHKSICGQFGVKGFPTIKVFGANKGNPEDYQGERTAAGIVQVAQRAAQKIVQDRLGGKSSGEKAFENCLSSGQSFIAVLHFIVFALGGKNSKSLSFS